MSSPLCSALVLMIHNFTLNRSNPLYEENSRNVLQRSESTSSGYSSGPAGNPRPERFKSKYPAKIPSPIWPKYVGENESQVTKRSVEIMKERFGKNKIDQNHGRGWTYDGDFDDVTSHKVCSLSRI